jgi:flagellar motor switch protein FliN/FliY
MSQPPSQADIDALFAGGASTAAPKMDEFVTEPPIAPDFGAAPSAGSGYSAPLETLLDVSMPVTIEFGRTSMTVQEVLQLATGSVIQLQRMVGEPIDIYVSDRKLAEGEVVVIGEHFGVRITKIMIGTEQTQG